MHGCRRTIAFLLIGAGLVATPACVAQEAPAAPPQAAQEFKTADELLDALETADRDLRSLTAEVKFDKTFELQGDRQTRTGKLWFDSQPAKAGEPGALPLRRFAVRFDKVWIAEVRRVEDKTYIFDGQWLMEKDAIERFFQKKQVVGPGEHFDPLKVGNGPFVLPIGQRKGDIKERFNVELLPATAGLDVPAEGEEADKKAAEEARTAATGSWQLRLTPKPGFESDEEFSEVRLWYKRGAQGELLPRMARTVKPPGDVATVVLLNVEVQLAGKAANPAARVAPEVFDVTPPEGWDGQVMPWRKRGEPVGAEPRDAGDK
jgi:hypothetical protein